MKGLSIEGFLKLINKYGATAVLAAWLFVNNVRIAKLENQLYDCYKTRSTAFNDGTQRKFSTFNQLVAILSEKPRTVTYKIRRVS
jgi:hypothetical protein